MERTSEMKWALGLCNGLAIGIEKYCNPYATLQLSNNRILCFEGGGRVIRTSMPC